MRKLLLVLGAIFALLVFAGAAGVYVVVRTQQRRDERIVELEAQLPGLQREPTIDGEQACKILEHHLLTRPIDRALSVDCRAAKAEPTGAGVIRLAGTVYGRDVDNAIFGGGFGTSHCLARSELGWEVVGQAWRLDECAFDAATNVAVTAIASSALEGVAARRRAVAERAILGVRQAMAHLDSVPAVCPDLAHAGGRAVGMVDTQLWSEGGFGEGDGFWRSLCSPAFLACAEGEEPSQFSLGCGLEEPWRVVLVLDEATKDPPRVISADAFVGGDYHASLMLVDLASSRVICARPLEVALEGTVLLSRGDWIVGHYHERIKEQLCAEVENLTQGKVELDPYWGCG